MFGIRIRGWFRLGHADRPSPRRMYVSRLRGRQLLWLGALWVLLVVVTCAARERGALPGISVAYIDPGSGSLALQLLAAVFVGLLFYIKRVGDFLARTWARLWDQRRR